MNTKKYIGIWSIILLLVMQSVNGGGANGTKPLVSGAKSNTASKPPSDNKPQAATSDPVDKSNITYYQELATKIESVLNHESHSQRWDFNQKVKEMIGSYNALQKQLLNDSNLRDELSQCGEIPTAMEKYTKLWQGRDLSLKRALSGLHTHVNTKVLLASVAVDEAETPSNKESNKKPGVRDKFVGLFTGLFRTTK